MGRGTAILRFGSALHSRRFPGPSTQRLFRWLEQQLDMRGVDPALYSRYLISLLQLDDAEFERSEISDHEFELDEPGGGEATPAGAVGGGGGKRAARKSKRRRQQQPPQVAPDCSAAIGLTVSSRKRAAAVRCLQSVCTDPHEVDELIDELCYRLKRLNSATGGVNGGSGGGWAPALPSFLPALAEEACTDSVLAAAADSGQCGTPEEASAEEGEEAAAGRRLSRSTGGQAEDYGCAFPALMPASPPAAALPARVLRQHQLGRLLRQGADSAWSRGPPRGLGGSRVREEPDAAVLRQRDDEGFLEDREDTDYEDDEDEEDGDDAVSIASEGSEILQLVSHILHSFNRELAEHRMDDGEDVGGVGEVADLLPACDEAVWAAAGVGGGADASGLVPALMVMTDADAEVLSDHDFDNLPSQEEEPIGAADAFCACCDCDDDEQHLVDDELAPSLSGPFPERRPPAPAPEVRDPPLPPPRVSMATGILALPEAVVLSGMASWTPLDRLRHQMWSRKPLPPQPQRKPAAAAPAIHHQPMTPLEKSQRACSFLLRGHCKKEDCEFAHDLARVTCKFWSAGECFKGNTCPFRHSSSGGAASAAESGASVASSADAGASDSSDGE